jgi:hypothetical protein
VGYGGVLAAELRDANPHTHDAIQRLVVYCGGEVVSINGTTLVARPAPTNSGGELLMRHVLKDPAVIPETVAWS